MVILGQVISLRINIYGDLTAKGSNAYILVDDALRITDKRLQQRQCEI